MEEWKTWRNKEWKGKEWKKMSCATKALWLTEGDGAIALRSYSIRPNDAGRRFVRDTL